MPTLTIDGQEVTVEPGCTVLQACEVAGVEIPRFCYHERLSIAGNCRMCLVEMEKSPKPVASCAMPAGDGMVIRTNTPSVKKAREGVLEFLLINHPLDCPICDQGGECDLQDLTMGYGPGGSRYDENKRAVEEKEFGPLIKTHMTRCIHCTRCVRFLDEVAGSPELGGIGRGEHMEIDTFVQKSISSELSGNIIDLCPVGALTSKPYAFTARSWELRKAESVDVLDAVGSNIRVDFRGREVMRILPRLNEDVNEEWIADKTRFAYDGLRRQRLDRPYVRQDGRLRPVTWAEAFDAIAAKLRGIPGERIGAIAGDLCDAEAMFALKGLMAALGSGNIDCRQDGAKLDAGVRASYLFNTTIRGIEEADACLLIGTNPRWEAPLINARLRKRWLRGGFEIGRIGVPFNLTYRLRDLGAGPQSLSEIVDGTHEFCSTLSKAERPMMILGSGAVARPDGAAVLMAARKIAEANGMIQDDWNGFNVLHRAASRVGGLDLGFVPEKGAKDVAGMVAAAGKGELDILFLMGADEIDMAALGETFVIYQGHHGDAGAHRADVVLPGATYTEKDGLYVNTEGRVQEGRRAVFPPGEAREDWTILRALSDVLGVTLPYDSLRDLRLALYEAAPTFAVQDRIEPAPWGKFGGRGKLKTDPFVGPVDNYYMTDPITRASETMAKCSAMLVQEQEKATGTDD
ncbi:MAG: NADH-quinone oxidoreductase subunit G [Rhodospirillaceae bacterium]|nr:NADH-quinone oxidoreductase subunit G [Rhodospirillaceae bacterium]